MMRRRGTFTNTYRERERHSCHITYYRTYTLTYSNSSSHRGGHTHSHIQVHKVEDTLTHALTRTLTHALTHTLVYTLTHTLTHMEKHGGMEVSPFMQTGSLNRPCSHAYIHMVVTFAGTLLLSFTSS